MTSLTALVELGERYAALGLPAAARGAFARAHAAAPADDATAARRLAELAMASGDGAEACRHARDVLARDPGPAARILLGRAQLAAGELGGARFSFSAALELARSSGLVRARAHLGHAAVAAASGDHTGAGAHAMAGLDELVRLVEGPERPPGELDTELPLIEELLARVIEAGRADDAQERIASLAEHRPEAPAALWRALLLAARQARGDSAVSDGEIEQALARALEHRPGSRATRLRLIERRLRRRYLDAKARTEAMSELMSKLTGELADMAQDPGGEALSPAESIALARVCFLLAAACEEDPGHADRVEALYRQGLRLRPGHASAVHRLALLALARGDGESALTEIERALRMDPGPGLAWRSAVRVLDAAFPAPGPAPGAMAETGRPRAIERVLDAAEPGASAAADLIPQLMSATAEIARDDVLAGMYTRGHRVKNVLGIIGARARAARKLAGEGALASRLADLEREVTALYDEWAAYLRSMQTAGPVIEVLPAGVLLTEVVEAARAGRSVAVSLAVAGSLPDLRGDRMLLREALLNLISNAAEACESTGGRVDVAARVVASGSTPLVEIAVSDTGPGIPRADLPRVFAPGFTTKESGSGIGLAIAERVVSAHHGRISIDSEVGHGTRVTVILPSDLGGFASLGAFSRFDAEDR